MRTRTHASGTVSPILNVNVRDDIQRPNTVGDESLGLTPNTSRASPGEGQSTTNCRLAELSRPHTVVPPKFLALGK